MHEGCQEKNSKEDRNKKVIIRNMDLKLKHMIYGEQYMPTRIRRNI